MKFLILIICSCFNKVSLNKYTKNLGEKSVETYYIKQDIEKEKNLNKTCIVVTCIPIVMRYFMPKNWNTC